MTVKFEYQYIKSERTFDIDNISLYNLILGTSFLYEHSMCIGLNPAWVIIRSDVPLPMRAGVDTKPMVNMLSPVQNNLEAVRETLHRYVEPLCKDVSEHSYHDVVDEDV